MSDFDQEFVAWMSTLGTGTDFLRHDGGIDMGLDRGETVHYFDALPDGWVRLTHRLRDGRPYWDLDAATLEVAEVYVAVRYANSVRSHLGLEALDRRERVGRESHRLGTEVIPWQGPPIPERRPSRMEEYSAEGRPVARFGYPLGEYVPRLGHPSRVAGATWYIDRPLTEVLASLRHPTGAPLFEMLGDRRA